MKKAFQLLFCSLFICSCIQNENKTAYSGSYFNLKDYFKKESLRLSKKNAAVEKSVSKNDGTESKIIRINNWLTELSLFSESDINWPAWKNSYRLKTSAGQIQYIALQPSLRTRSIIINRKNGRINSIFIYNKTNNTLYTSSERLEYFPDSVYKIKKDQKVIFIGANKYSITGLIIK